MDLFVVHTPLRRAVNRTKLTENYTRHERLSIFIILNKAAIAAQSAVRVAVVWADSALPVRVSSVPDRGECHSRADEVGAPAA